MPPSEQDVAHRMAADLSAAAKTLLMEAIQVLREEQDVPAFDALLMLWSEACKCLVALSPHEAEALLRARADYLASSRPATKRLAAAMITRAVGAMAQVAFDLEHVSARREH